MKMLTFNAVLTDLFTLDEFLYHVDEGHFVDSDGQGYYGTPTHYDVDSPARPSVIAKGIVNSNGYTCVHWFNK